MLNFPLALAFNGWFVSGVWIHPWIAAGRAWTGASEARIGHTYSLSPINQEFSVSENPYGQFSQFHVCFCGLDLGNLKFETARTNKQHICF